MSKKVTCSQDPGKGKAGVLSLLFLSVCGRGMNIKKSGFNIFSGCTKDRGALQAWFLLDPVSRFCAQTAKKQQHFLFKNM